ncbi:eukaryotic translation initiation factor 4E type 2 isoform X2 [Synchiropus splendidus]|uniref:eukaryotic translation initiation factor 4E type 2 isoform X2 n=1 Tax=Synchiropus splendidus TaxID=270530 RepID=UPI00237EA610|nr:eukaryotic translation initiation factor 4E type 2 isoform X2 [Synchiropus splendidus]
MCAGIKRLKQKSELASLDCFTPYVWSHVKLLSCHVQLYVRVHGSSHCAPPLLRNPGGSSRTRKSYKIMNNKFDALKDDDSGDHEQDQGSPKDCEKEKIEDEEKEQNITKKKMVVPGAGEHPLQYNYTFWYSRRTPGRPASTQSYEQNIKQIGSFASVEQFWRFYSHMIRPGDLTGHSDFHLFKEGIKPMWEDDANKMGGKWIIRLRKGLASRCWENLILAMLGEQFMVGEEICGAVVSVRFQEDIISIWNKTASDQATTARIRDTLRRVLNLPPNTIMEYKTHTDSIKAWEDFHGLVNASGGR